MKVKIIMKNNYFKKFLKIKKVLKNIFVFELIFYVVLMNVKKNDYEMMFFV